MALQGIGWNGVVPGGLGGSTIRIGDAPVRIDGEAPHQCRAWRSSSQGRPEGAARAALVIGSAADYRGQGGHHELAAMPL